MRAADIGLVNLTPFRGVSADCGTVLELGFLFARGVPVYGYSSAHGAYLDRVAASPVGLVRAVGIRPTAMAFLLRSSASPTT